MDSREDERVPINKSEEGQSHCPESNVLWFAVCSPSQDFFSLQEGKGVVQSPAHQYSTETESVRGGREDIKT